MTKCKCNHFVFSQNKFDLISIDNMPRFAQGEVWSNVCSKDFVPKL